MNDNFITVEINDKKLDKIIKLIKEEKLNFQKKTLISRMYTLHKNNMEIVYEAYVCSDIESVPVSLRVKVLQLDLENTKKELKGEIKELEDKVSSLLQYNIIEAHD